MYKSMNRSALVAALIGASLYRSADIGTDGSGATPPAAAPVVKTKDEILAGIKAQIDKLTQKYDDVLNDRQPQVKAKKEVFIPVAGERVLATIGRTTATTQAKVLEALVLGVKVPAPGEKGATQVKVRIYEGTFEEQTVVLYLTAIEKAPAPATPATDNFGNEI